MRSPCQNQVSSTESVLIPSTSSLAILFIMIKIPAPSTLHKNVPHSVWFLGFVSLFADINSKMIQSTLPLFLVSTLGVNLATVGLIEGIAESTASVLKVFSGALSDYWRKRKGLAIAGYGSHSCSDWCSVVNHWSPGTCPIA
jgi:hypothetical protein